MITIEEVLRMVIDAHEGQKDLDGNPAVLHPLTVGLMGGSRQEMVAGFLHDVVEDTDYTFDDLLAMGVEPEVVDVLRLLTHDRSMSYEEYVGRIASSGNEVAIRVKYNDLCHNLKRGRAGGHAKQVAKHEKAFSVIFPLIKQE